MARAWEWLLGAFNCQPLLAMLTPAAPVDPNAHLETLRDKIEKMGDEKAYLDKKLVKMNGEYRELLKKGRVAAARILKEQMAQYVQRCKKIEHDNKLVLGQYNELLHMREDSKMVEASVTTTALLKSEATRMRSNMRALGGADGMETVLEEIADIKQDAADLVGFASRSLLPVDIRDTGVVTAPMSLDEELDAYLGELEVGTSRAASSVAEPPAVVVDPYVTTGTLIGN